MADHDIITRRAVLKGAGTAALTAGSAGAALAMTSSDPAVAAYWRWRASCDVVDNAPDKSDEAMAPLHDASYQAMCDLCQTKATTMEGLILQLRASFYVVGEPTFGQSLDDLDAYDFTVWTDGWEGVLLKNMLTTAQGLAS